MKKILVVQGGGRVNGNTTQLVDYFVFASPLYFWTISSQLKAFIVSYYQFALVNYIGFHDMGMLLAGGCGDTNGKPQIDKTPHLQEAYEFGKKLYPK